MSNNTVIQSSHLIPKTTKSLERKALSHCVETLKHALIQRHIFICSDSTVANCCSKQASLESWEYLKKRLRELQLNQPPDIHPICISQNESQLLACLLFWADNGSLPGWGLVSTTKERKSDERIIQEHLIGIMVVEA
ncbi:ferredoxin [Cylindrospermum sp. FACHB-282]|uniref:ferredoxin n=1 Tax=Cylindrospermum sp. FACHB-282 TaxID=2692794 RepID=UPI001F558CBD|nr:ferredoxin [Cylindrospermum sp. FACHB-282]